MVIIYLKDNNLDKYERGKIFEKFLSPNELSPNIKKIIMTKLKEKYLYREIDGKMITDIQIIDYNNLPLINNLELNIYANVTYKTYTAGDIIKGEFFSCENDNRVFVLSYDIICEILNVNDFNEIKDKNIVNVVVSRIKSTNGCVYFLAEGNIINSF